VSNQGSRIGEKNIKKYFKIIKASWRAPSPLITPLKAADKRGYGEQGAGGQPHVYSRGPVYTI